MSNSRRRTAVRLLRPWTQASSTRRTRDASHGATVIDRRPSLLLPPRGTSSRLWPCWQRICRPASGERRGRRGRAALAGDARDDTASRAGGEPLLHSRAKRECNAARFRASRQLRDRHATPPVFGGLWADARAPRRRCQRLRFCISTIARASASTTMPGRQAPPAARARPAVPTALRDRWRAREPLPARVSSQIPRARSRPPAARRT